MNNDFSSIDIVVFASYAFIILSVGLWVSRNKKGETKSAEDYFLASKSFHGGQLVLHLSLQIFLLNNLLECPVQVLLLAWL